MARMTSEMGKGRQRVKDRCPLLAAFGIIKTVFIGGLALY
jgi:hypothetical protein